MKVTCELNIGNDQEHPGVKILFEGEPTEKRGFIHLRIGDVQYELRPSEVAAALQRVRSDA